MSGSKDGSGNPDKPNSPKNPSDPHLSKTQDAGEPYKGPAEQAPDDLEATQDAAGRGSEADPNATLDSIPVVDKNGSQKPSNDLEATQDAASNAGDAMAATQTAGPGQVQQQAPGDDSMKATQDAAPNGSPVSGEAPRVLASRSRAKPAAMDTVIQKSKPQKTAFSRSMGHTLAGNLSRVGQSILAGVQYHKPKFIWLFILLAFVALVFQIPFFRDMELTALDYYMRHKTNIPDSQDIVLLEIQDACIEEIGSWPWTRNVHAAALDIMNRYLEPRLIGYDILFTEYGSKKVRRGDKLVPSNAKIDRSDLAFRLKIKKAGNVYLPGSFLLGDSQDGPLMKQIERYQPPHEKFMEAAAGTGHIFYRPDADGTVRRVPLALYHEGIWVPHLALRMVLDLLEVPWNAVTVIPGKTISFKTPSGEMFRIPIDEDCQMLLAWAGPFEETFVHEGYRNIIQYKAAQNYDAVNARIDPRKIQNKIVIVGFTATGTVDYKPTPIETEYPLLGLHATLINQILRQIYIQKIPNTINLVLCLLLAALMGYVALQASPQRGFVVLFLMLALILSVTFLLFYFAHIWIDPARPVLTLVFTALVLGTYSHVRFKDHVDLKLSFEQKLNMADAKLPQFRGNLKIGHYTNISELGRGGMAIVYKGTGRDGKAYAVKVINPEYLNKEGYKYRFKREVLTMKKVVHPNVIRVYDSGTYQGVLFYAMELFEGGDLSDHMARLNKINDWPWITTFITQLFEGLQAIHAAGLIHRDIKPANIMMNDDNVIKIADFGLAKGADEGQMLTTVGQVLGTPAYLAPELCSGEEPDFQADIYAMGILAYEIVGRERPFHECTTMAALMQAKMNRPIMTVKAKRPEIPDPLAAAIDKMVAAKPEDRYTDCAAVLEELHACL